MIIGESNFYFKSSTIDGDHLIVNIFFVLLDVPPLMGAGRLRYIKKNSNIERHLVTNSCNKLEF